MGMGVNRSWFDGQAIQLKVVEEKRGGGERSSASRVLSPERLGA